MSELKDGYYDGYVIAVDIIKSRFAKEGENRMEVELDCGVYDAERKPMQEHAKVYLELSSDYPKFGNTTQPFWQQTLDRLHEIGFAGEDLSTLDVQLKGKGVRLNYRTVDKQGVPLKSGPQWYLSGEKKVEKIAAADANAMLKQMMAGVVAAPYAATPASTPAATPHPFQ